MTPPIFKQRAGYKPFEYTFPHTIWEKQQSVHWLPSEVQLSSKDVKDWRENLTEIERNLIGNILKGFTQTETVVNEYWTKYVASWFPKHEIKKMAITFGGFETIHAESYSNLNEELGLDDFEAFLEDEATAAKIENITSIDKIAHTLIKNPEEYTLEEQREIAKSLAIFSAFTEGVNLFSSFAVLMSFSMRNLLKAVGELIKFSIRDESLHSTGGCWLYNQLISENPDILTEEFKQDIYEAARITVKLELDFINKAFEMGDIQGLNRTTMENYIKFRCNTKLGDLQLKPIFEYDEKEVQKMDWFTSLSAGTEFRDFFDGRVTEYAKGQQDWSKVLLHINNENQVQKENNV